MSNTVNNMETESVSRVIPLKFTNDAQLADKLLAESHPPERSKSAHEANLDEIRETFLKGAVAGFDGLTQPKGLKHSGFFRLGSVMVADLRAWSRPIRIDEARGVIMQWLGEGWQAGMSHWNPPMPVALRWSQHDAMESIDEQEWTMVCRMAFRSSAMSSWAMIGCHEVTRSRE